MSEPVSVCPLLASQPRMRSRDRFFKTVKWEEVYLHQYQTFEEAAAAPADVSGGCLQCQTSPLVFGLPARLLSLSCNTRCVNVLVVCTFWGHSTMPYAVKYAVSPQMPGEEVCGQARRQAL